MRWNERTTDGLGTFKKIRPTCYAFYDLPLADRAPRNREAIRDLIFGPKALAELAILRRLAAD